MTDFELEQHIADLGQLIEKAYAGGDRASAVAWAAARADAIKARSPEQAPCYFTEAGEAARQGARP